MLAEIAARTSWIAPPLVGLVLFTAIFAAAWLWVFNPSRKKHYDRMARLAVDSEEGTRL